MKGWRLPCQRNALSYSKQMDDLFGEAGTTRGDDHAFLPTDAPLAARMRPRTLDEYVGQGHILGEGKLLRRAIEADRLSSVIFYGPPGTGKTSLARVIAARTESRFIELSGVEGSVADIRKAVGVAAIEARNGGRTLLFIDEIHRFNKAQQDVLLPDVESGVIALIGATTQNPFFALTSALVSRSRIFELESLSRDDIAEIVRRAAADRAHGLGTEQVTLTPDAVAESSTNRRFVSVAMISARVVLPTPGGP